MTDWFDTVEDAMETEEAVSQQIEEAEEWNPMEGDILKGIFLKANMIDTKYGPAILAVIRDLDHPEQQAVKVWCSRTVLKNEMLEAEPKVGSMIAIKYLGERTTRDGSTNYHAYMVRAQESDPAFWTALQLPQYEDDGTGRPQMTEAQEAVRDALNQQDWNPDEAPF